MRILFLASRFPYPLEKGDKLRAFHQIKELSRNHEIILFALSDQPVEEESLRVLKQYCKEIHVRQLSKIQVLLNLTIAFFKGWPFQVGYFYRSKWKREIHAIIEKEKPDAIFCQLIRMSEFVKDVKGIRKTLDYMDVFSKGMERRLELTSPWMKIPIRMEYKRLLRYEENIFSHFDEKVIITAQDKNLIPHVAKDQIHVIPNGVDYEEFHPLKTEKKYDLLFAGNMGYPPNIEAVIYTVKNILPLVWKKRPETTFVIAGANPSKEVSDLSSEKVIVTGFVKDIRTYFAESRMMIAPMLISIGLQNKILQAMAMEIPCVISALANNAIGAPANCVKVAKQPEEYANEILALLEDEASGKLLAANAVTFVHEQFDWGRASDKLEAILAGG